ncbi:MAG TPA: adenylate/guanylate cyclase domain-containing protein, partial [Geminicoccaceae bacterium]|nr:adenylate/guanylate cyclase domain-containing protein [Geminicoccaceae bacterium]
MATVDIWLAEIGLGRYAELFARHQIDLDVLPDLTEADLAKLGVTLGDRKRLMRAVAELAQPAAQSAGREPARGAAAAAMAAFGRGAERRHLTVMFCDMVGSTALSARLDPEDLHEVIRRYQTVCAQVIARFDGYIGHYVGDGILVYFGFPCAHEDDARRAVQAGLEIVEAVQALSAEIDRPGVELAVRVGINTGLVVAGDLGTGQFRDEMAVVGETPNIAARLQELAEPGSVVVGESTRRLVEGLFVFDPLGERPLKGIDRSIPVYRVRGASGARSRFEARAIRGLTPLVGRDEELNLLLSRWGDALAGEGQVVLLTGEPGIGKSRLIQAFRERVRGDGVTVLRYFCSPFYVHSALHPVLDQLERAAQLKKSDPPEVKLDKLEALLRQGTERVGRATALLAPLLSIPTGERYADLDVTPERKKALALEALLEQLAGLAAQPVLIILEDAHWIDPTSAELFQLIIERIQRMPVMAVIAYRTGFTPPWGRFPHVTALSLAHLSHRHAVALVERLTRGRKLPPEVLEHIVTRTDGVPLFAEELTKSLFDSGALELVGDAFRLTRPLPSLSVPESLHDSLMARLDRLAEVKDVAHLAATLGRVFHHELLAAVSNLDEAALGRALDQLVDAELIYRRGTPPDAVYEFKHALVQDAAYNSLLRSRRQQFHRRIGETLEDRFAETVASKPELLAHHFREAALPAKAFVYAMRAGDAAAARYAATEARARFQEALELAQSLPPSENTARAQIEASLKLASVAQHRGHYEADLKNLEQARIAAESLNDRASLCQISYWIGRINYIFGRFDQAADYAGKALLIAEGLGGDDRYTADAVNLLGRIHCLRGEPREAITHAKRNVPQMHRLGSRIEEAAMSGVLAFAYGMHGEFDKAFEAARFGMELSRQIEHLPTQAACVFFYGVVRGWHGDLDVAVPEFDHALALCDKAGDVFRKYLAHGWRGQAYLMSGRRPAAAADLTRCLELGDQIGTTFHRGAFQAFRAKLHLLEGEVGAALRDSVQALEVANETAQAWSRSIALRIHAEALLAVEPPRIEQAEDEVRAAIDIQARRECVFDLAWSRLALAAVHMARDDREEAVATLHLAARMFGEMG